MSLSAGEGSGAAPILPVGPYRSASQTEPASGPKCSRPPHPWRQGRGNGGSEAECRVAEAAVRVDLGSENPSGQCGRAVGIRFAGLVAARRTGPFVGDARLCAGNHGPGPIGNIGDHALVEWSATPPLRDSFDWLRDYSSETAVTGDTAVASRRQQPSDCLPRPLLVWPRGAVSAARGAGRCRTGERALAQHLLRSASCDGRARYRW